MPITSSISLFIFFGFFLTGLRKNADFLSPGRIFGMLWSIVIALVGLKLSYLQFSWTLFEWFMVLLGVLTFLLGVYISYIINLDKNFLPLSEIRKKIREINFDEKKIFNFISIYFFLYLICFVLEWQLEGYLPLFTSNPSKARLTFGIFGLHLIVSSANVILFLIIQYFIFIKAHVEKKILLILFFILALGNYILIVQRYGLFVLIMMAFCLFYYSGRRIRPRTIIILSIILLLLVIGVQSLRESELAKAYILLGSRMKSSNNSELAIPYMYLVMNVENFAKYFSHIENHSFGFFSLDFLTALTGIKHSIEQYFYFDKYRYYIAGYNTFPFYWPYYLDFGVTGLAVIPLILGFIISEVYYYLHRNPNLIILTIYSALFSTIVISYSSDPLTRLDMMFNFGVITFAQLFFYKNLVQNKI
jgi:oligosaccharide repeat unit polymerase